MSREEEMRRNELCFFLSLFHWFVSNGVDVGVDIDIDIDDESYTLLYRTNYFWKSIDNPSLPVKRDRSTMDIHEL
jgi:hypothetical protein